MKYALPVILIGLAVAAPAQAQYGGGRGTGRMPQSGRPPASQGQSRPAPRARAVPPPPARAPVNLSQYIAYGVVEAVDPVAGRVTLAYQPIEAMNWPAGTKPFQVAKNKLLDGIQVGDRVGFKMESQQITQLQVIGGKPAEVSAPAPASGVPIAPPPKGADELGRAAFRR